MDANTSYALRMGRAIVATVLCALLIGGPGVCMSPQPTAKEGNELARFRQAGLTKDRSQIPALLATLRNPPERFCAFTSLHTLAQLGATEALPAVNSLLATSRDIDLVNSATAAKARVLAESGAQTVKDPKARANLATLYQHRRVPAPTERALLFVPSWALNTDRGPSISSSCCPLPPAGPEKSA